MFMRNWTLITRRLMPFFDVALVLISFRLAYTLRYDLQIGRPILDERPPLRKRLSADTTVGPIRVYRTLPTVRRCRQPAHRRVTRPLWISEDSEAQVP